MPRVPDAQADARYVVIDGRRWRRSAPGIPEALRKELVQRLMHGRRGVAAARRARDLAAEKAARAVVHDAKLALGERGPAWWDAPDQDALAQRAGAIVRTLLRERTGRSVSPTEVARILVGDRVRPLLPLVRGVMQTLSEQAELELVRHGTRLLARPRPSAVP